VLTPSITFTIIITAAVSLFAHGYIILNEPAADPIALPRLLLSLPPAAIPLSLTSISLTAAT
jgi:hypothetical protein